MRPLISDASMAISGSSTLATTSATSTPRIQRSAQGGVDPIHLRTSSTLVGLRMCLGSYVGFFLSMGRSVIAR